MNNSQNPHFWWWTYLCASDRTQWSERVEQHFGPYVGLPFDQWWEACKDLFLNVEQLKARGELAEEAVVELIASPEQWDVLDGEIAVRVDLSWPKKDILEHFDRLLRRVHKGERGRPKLDKDADYPFASRPDVIALELGFKAWKLRQTTTMTLYEIGERIGLKQHLVTNDDSPKAVSDKKQVMAATVSRYLNRTEKLLANVTQGKFPCAKHADQNEG